jgi:N-acetylneuraminate synthase/sialic acid synthase
MTREITIDGVAIGDASDCYVIAEIGHNHQGNLETARKMITSAKECGASAVKLQKRDNRTLFTKAAYHKPYDSENAFGPTYGLHREALEFGRAEYTELAAYSKELGITFFATAFDFPSADFLAELDMPAYKMASGDLRNLPLLKYVARIGRPMIISTGGAGLDDVRRACDAVLPINPQLCVLQCTAAYPVNWEEIDLRVIETYREKFPGVVVGLSAHDNGIAIAVAAYMIGARVVEKHFTLNRTMRGTDHAFSLEPVGLTKLVRDLKRTRIACGDGVKKVYPSEVAPIAKMGKAIVAARPLPAGHVLKADDLAFKSPGGGLHPYQLDDVVGSRTLVALEEEQMIRLEDLAQTRLRKAA